MKIIILDNEISIIELEKGISFGRATMIALELYEQHPNASIYIQCSDNESVFVDPYLTTKDAI